MAQDRDQTRSPPLSTQVANVAKDTIRPSLSPLRQRTLRRSTNFAEHPLRKRRSSTFSDSVDSTRQSIKSSTDDLLLPRANNSDSLTNNEPSHWHSVPLALALLPAVGGLFFKEGSAVITDLTLLGLAAIFLNWSVRLPWDWYHSAQAVKEEDPYPPVHEYPSDTIVEEGSDEEETPQISQPSPVQNPNATDPPTSPTSQSLSRSSASSELRIHESLALFTCFVSPAIGAWLLHHIRGQLSRPSEGLVSNYNLTIFLLASEVRPLSHLIKLVQARTLHLQRTVSTNQSQPATAASPGDLADLTHRLDELEKHLADSTTNGSPGAKPPTPQDLTSQARKAVQSDLDALNRAVRRYEKRATLLSLQTESRLQDVEKRMNDAITLAAAAERSSQSNKQRRGSGVVMMVDWAASLMLLPMQVLWAIISFPGKVLAGIVTYVEEVIGRKVRRELKTAGRGDGKNNSGSERRKIAGRGQKKTM